MNRACFPKEKTPEFTKKGEIHELFVFALTLVWFAWAAPEYNSEKLKMVAVILPFADFKLLRLTKLMSVTRK